MVGHAVSGLHEVTVVLFVEHFDLTKPLTRRRANPTRNERARRETVMPGQRLAVHAHGDESVSVTGLFDRDAADEGRHFSWHFIQTTKHNVLSSGFHPSPLQNILQTWTAEARRTDRALLPLHAGNLGTLKRPPVTGTLEGVGDRMRLHPDQIREFQRQWFLDFT